MPGVPPERGDRAAHLAGMTRYIHDGIELLARKRLKTVRHLAIDVDKADAGRNRTRQTSCGARHIMAGRAGMGGNRAPEKLAAA
jgi:hypothetical protein